MWSHQIESHRREVEIEFEKFLSLSISIYLSALHFPTIALLYHQHYPNQLEILIQLGFRVDRDRGYCK